MALIARRVMSLLVALSLLVASALPAPALQEAAPPAQNGVPSVEDIQKTIKDIETAADIDEALRTRLLESWKLALEQAQAAAVWKTKAAEFDARRQEAPASLEAIKQELAQPIAEPAPDAKPEETLVQWEQAAAQVDSDLAAANKLAIDLETEQKNRGTRRQDIPKLITSVKQRLTEVQEQIAAAPPAEEPARVTEARRTALRAKKLAIEMESAALDAESLSYEARVELLQARRDQAVRRALVLDKLSKAWKERISERHKREAEEQARATREAAAKADPAVRKEADVNVELAERRSGPDGLAQKIEQIGLRLDETQKLAARVQEQYDALQNKIKLVGMTNTVGFLLRKQRAGLPDLSEYRRNIHERQEKMSAAQYDLIEIEEQSAELVRLLAEVSDEQAATPMMNLERLGVLDALKKIYEDRRDIYGSLIKDYDRYMPRLVDLDAAERQLIQEVTEFQTFIDKHVLWISSAKPLSVEHAAPAFDAALWLGRQSNWMGAARFLAKDFRRYPVANLLLVLALVILWMVQPRIRRNLRANGEPAEQGEDSIRGSMVSMMLTFLVACPLPALLFALGWRLSGELRGDPFTRSLGLGLIASGAVLLPLDFFRQACRKYGLGSAHFEWPAPALLQIRRLLFWMIVLGLPVTLLVTMMDEQGNEVWGDSLGRMLFIYGLLQGAVFVMIFLRRRGAVMTALTAHNPRSVFVRLRWLWMLLACAVPVILAGLAWAGYYFTAKELAWRVYASLWLSMLMIFAYSILARWVSLAMQRREAAEGKDAPDEEKSKLAGQQSRQLISIALGLMMIFMLWSIWRDIVPALGFFDRFHLWSYTAVTMEDVTDPDGTVHSRATEHPAFVTLEDLVVALAVLFLAALAARNLPGLLDVALSRFPIDAAARYAIKTLATYVVTILALIIAIGTLGISWQSIQWLVAAMTVGLGFGLQEIFANFVSGVILLFEQPIRVGDIVSVGTVEGKVTQIKMRATIIMDWDNRELVVPNKEFIAGQLINWTLTSPVTRVVFPVGIAYGSDVDKARDLLLTIGRDNPYVLLNPAPTVVFRNFGDNCLDFQLRVYLSNREFWQELTNSVNFAINKRFNDAGIEIAFPQRDIHIRSIDIDAARALHDKTGEALSAEGGTA